MLYGENNKCLIVCLFAANPSVSLSSDTTDRSSSFLVILFEENTIRPPLPREFISSSEKGSGLGEYGFLSYY